ncbi:neuropilin-2-like [Oculina patagonica]
MSLRMELYGCRSGFSTPQPPVCQEGLGLENYAIPDSSITASSSYSSTYLPGNGRLHFKKKSGHYGAWAAGNKRDNSWFQVDFGRFVKVTIISTQGRDDSAKWVTKYRVTYSYDGQFFRDYKEEGYVKEFEGNSDRYSVVSHKLENPIIARYIRINPISYHSWIEMRADFYGCKSGFPIPNVVSSCKDPLGMESGLIPNSAITASSKYSAAYGPENARLNFEGAAGRYGGWVSGKNDHSQWLQVNFGRETQVTGIATQGYHNKMYFVKSYTLQYSHDGSSFQQYQPESHTKIFFGNNDQNGVISYDLIPPITAKYMRIIPESWYRYIAMRVELYGCRAINGGYSDWGPYGQCSKTCAGGVKTRTRTCTNPPPGNGGEDCSALGPDTSSRRCNTQDCPVNGGYSDWGSYGICSKTCGAGVQTRKRTCTNPPPANGGEDCSGLGPESSTRECNNQECQKSWTKVGCYQNRGRALGDVLFKPNRFAKIATKYEQCVAEADAKGVTLFGFEDTKCWSGSKAYDMYGKAVGKCGSTRKGLRYGYGAKETMFVYEKNGGTWQPIDCYNNVSPKDEFALPESFDNNVGSVTGPDAIFDYCRGKAEAFGYKMFGADDKSCWSGDDAESTYNKYGESHLCDVNRKTGHGVGKDKNGDVYVYKLA